MNQQFFEKILPTQGTYCVASIKGTGKDKTIIPRFTEDASKVISTLQALSGPGANLYFTPGTYEGFRRSADECVAMKAFFLDLDYMHGKFVYVSKEAAIADTHRFCEEIGWPPPVLVDSGGGIHAYWIFDEDIPGDEWKDYAEQFKQLCIDRGMVIDQAVPADAARLMRVPGTFNYRYDPPEPATLLTEVFTYPIEQLLQALPESAPQVLNNVTDVLASAEKGLDEETQRIWDEYRKNFEFSFNKIALQSLNNEGCNQIKEAILNAKTLAEPQWYAAVSVAVRCTEGMEAVHNLSEDYPGYSKEETERKAQQSLDNATGAHSCEAFEALNAEGCKGCPFRGKLGKMGPIALGKSLRIAPSEPESTPESGLEFTPEAEQETDEAEPIRQEAGPHAPFFPDFLKPFVRGVNGGIYYLPPPKHLKDGRVIQDDPHLLLAHDLYAVKRLYSPLDGECLVMHLQLPKDGLREFVLPLKEVAAQEKLKAALASQGVVFEPQRVAQIATYLMKWGSFLISSGKADIMYMQQGWTDQCRSFVLGATEYEARGTRPSPPSVWSRNISKYLVMGGDFDAWKRSIQMLNEPGYELHAFIFLCGLASPLMEFSTVNGVTVSAMGESGSGKTGAMYAAMSVWGRPDALAVNDGTANGLIQRMVNMKNLPFVLDEQSNLSPKDTSDLIYKVSAGRSKLRMQASNNAERPQDYLTKLICIATVNQSLKDKVGQFKADASAEEMRLFEINLSRPKTLTEMRGRLMFDSLKRNYGHAGPLYATKLVELGAPRLSQIVDEETTKVTERFTGKSEYRFLIGLAGVVFAAERIGREIGMPTFDMDRIGAVVFGELNRTLRDTTESQLDNSLVLGDFLANSAQNILLVTNGNIGTVTPRGALTTRIEIIKNEKDCDVFISATALKTYLVERQLSVAMFERELKMLGSLKGKIKKRLGAGWAGLGPVNLYAYHFRMPTAEFATPEELNVEATSAAIAA